MGGSEHRRPRTGHISFSHLQPAAGPGRAAAAAAHSPSLQRWRHGRSRSRLCSHGLWWPVAAARGPAWALGACGRAQGRFCWRIQPVWEQPRAGQERERAPACQVSALQTLGLNGLKVLQEYSAGPESSTLQHIRWTLKDLRTVDCWSACCCCNRQAGAAAWLRDCHAEPGHAVHAAQNHKAPASGLMWPLAARVVCPCLVD